jgi:4'-phosphopantetheinyl transferase
MVGYEQTSTFGFTRNRLSTQPQIKFNAQLPHLVTVPVAAGVGEIVVVRLDVVPDAVSGFRAMLSHDERLRADRFAFDRDRRRFMVARATLRALLAQRLGILSRSVELQYGPHGKPSLARRCATMDLRFNVSHSEEVAVYAFAQGREVGVDVEAIRDLPDADGVAARFFSRKEHDAYLALEPCDRPLGFFNCWTRKEAFIKALGTGLHHPLGNFDVTLAPGAPAKILSVDGTPGEACGWTLESFSPAPGFVAALVIESPRC